MEKDDPVGAGLRPGVRRRAAALFASRILRYWSVSAQNGGMTRDEDAGRGRLTFSAPTAQGLLWQGFDCSSYWQF